MNPVSQAITAILATIGISGLIGFAVGYALKKILKLALIVIGLFIGTLFALDYLGIVEVHYNKLLYYANLVVHEFMGFSNAVYSHVVASIPMAAGFIAGFILGLKKGRSP